MRKKSVSLSSIFYPRAIFGAEKAPVVAMYGKGKDKFQITFVEFGNDSIRRSETLTIPDKFNEINFRLRVSKRAEFSALIPPAYEKGDILLCRNISSSSSFDLRQLSFNEEILNGIFVENATGSGSPSMAILLEERLLICHIDNERLIVKRERKIESQDGHVSEMAVSECGRYICIAALNGVKIFHVSLQGDVEFRQSIGYQESNSILTVYIEKFNGIYHLIFSEMLGPLRAFRLEAGIFVPAWDIKWAGAHAKSVLKGLGQTTGLDTNECLHVIINQLKPVQSMFHSIIDYGGDEKNNTKMNRNGAPPTAGLFDSGGMIYFSQCNEETKSGEVLAAWLS